MSSRARYLLRRSAHDLARHPRSWLRRLLRPTHVRLFGVKVLLDDRLSPRVRRDIIEERFERGEAFALSACLESGDTVLEVGTGVGLLATLAALEIGSDRVTTYEANPQLLPIIRDNFGLNGVTPTLVHALAGVAEGEGSLYLDSELYSASSRHRPTSRGQITVPQVDLRKEISRQRPTFLLMDVEGAEAELLPTVPWTTLRKVLVEIHPGILGADKAEELVRGVESAGFELDRGLSTRRVKLFRRR